MAIIDYKHVRVSDTETGNAADDLNENFRELADRTGLITLISDGEYTAYHPESSSAEDRGEALVSAMNAATAGSTILLGAATYDLASALAPGANNVTVIGSGRGTVIQRSGEVADVSSVSGFALRDVAVRGRVNLDAATYVLLQNIAWTANGQTRCLDGVNTSGDLHDIRIVDCEFTGGTADNYVRFLKADRVRIAGCLFWNSVEDALYFDEGGASSADNEVWSGPIITGNHFRNSGQYHLYVNGVHDPVITSNSMEDAADGGIYIRGPIQALISGNMLERNNQGASGTAAAIIVEIVDATQFDAMTGVGPSLVVGNSVGLEDWGVKIVGSFSQQADIRVLFNMLFNCPGIKIETYDAQYMIVCRGNSVVDRGGGTSVGIEAGSSSSTDGTLLKIVDNDIDNIGTAIRLDNITDVLEARNDITNATTDVDLLNDATTRSS